MVDYVNLEKQTKSLALNNIPQELRPYNQWGVCLLKGEEPKRPYNPVTGKPIDVTSPATWATWEECWKAVVNGPWGALGFILSKDDPFAGIDLDRTLATDTPEEVRNAHNEIMQVTASTYWEYSQSGLGYRGLLKTRLNFGGRKSSEHQMEVYDQERFLILTGGIKLNNPIVEDEGDWLNYIVAKLPAKVEGNMPDFKDNATEQDIIQRLENLSNWRGSKAQVLFDEGYPDDDTRSEHDQSLLDFLLQVTEDKNLIVDVFMSARGIDHQRIHSKRTSEEHFRKYVWKSMENQWRYREGRKAEVLESVRNFVPPNPQVAEVHQLTARQTTGIPELDAQVMEVLNTVPAESSLLPLSDHIRHRSIAVAGFDQPIMALMASVQTHGIAMARNFRLENLAPTFNMFYIAESGGAKDQILETPKDALVDAGLGQRIAGEPKSGAGLVNNLVHQYPVRIYFVDEAGDWLRKVQAQDTTNVSAPFKHISGRVRRIVFPGDYSDTTQAKDPAHYPAISLCAVSTLEQLGDLFETKNVRDGFVQRMTFVPSLTPAESFPDVHKSVLYNIPENIASTLRALASDSEGNIVAHEIIDRPEMVVMQVDKDAQDYLDDMTKTELAKRRASPQFQSRDFNTNEKLESRYRESAKRFAMILARSCGRINITLADLMWGLAVTKMSALTYLNLVGAAAEFGDAKEMETKVYQKIETLLARPSFGWTFTPGDRPYIKRTDLKRQLGDQRTKDYVDKMVKDGALEVMESRASNGKKVEYYRKPE